MDKLKDILKDFQKRTIELNDAYYPYSKINPQDNLDHLLDEYIKKIKELNG